MYEIFELLLQKYGITTYKFCKDTKVSQSTIYTWKKKHSLVGAEIGRIVCEYFGISMDYLMTGKNDIPQKNDEIALKEKREIGKDLDRVLKEIENDPDGPLFYNGEPIDDESLLWLRDVLRLGLNRLQIKKDLSDKNK